MALFFGSAWISKTIIYSNDPEPLLGGFSFLFLPLALSDDRRTPELRGPASEAVDCGCSC